jgi:hypothetical protein
MPFEKGHSGNPSGRPKVDTRVRELAQAQTESAIAGLVRVLEGEKTPAAARVSAAVALLDRGWGKPVQMITGDEENPIQITSASDRDVAKAIALIFAKGLSATGD